MNPALSIQDLSISLGTKEILSSIDLLATSGERLAIIGANGAGKSTLLKALLKLIPYSSGSIEIFSKDLKDYTSKEVAKCLAYVPQRFESSSAITSLEFILVGARPSSEIKSLSDLKELALNTLQKVGAANLANRSINTLSGGELQKILIASALAQRPKILLLDEPTLHLDPKAQIELEALTAKLCNDEDLLVIQVLHDLWSIMTWGDRVLALSNGEVVFDGRPSSEARKEMLELLFGCTLSTLAPSMNC